jgi:hypothetical protein
MAAENQNIVQEYIKSTSSIFLFLSSVYNIKYETGLYSVFIVGLLDVQKILSTGTGISRQTEGNSLCDHLISKSVSVTPSSIIEASIVLCSVSL